MSHVRIGMSALLIPDPEELLAALRKMLADPDRNISLHESELILSIVKEAVAVVASERIVSETAMASARDPENLLASIKLDLTKELKEAVIKMLKPVMIQTEVKWS